MSIGSEDPMDMEEERRLCYVGITRAMRELYLTAARQRMVRGEIHYNKVSRFVEDIPKEFLFAEEPKKETAAAPQRTVQKPYQQAREAFRTKAFVPQQFQVKKADALDYGIGDRVRHIKFGEGTVRNVTEGGRDYEVTVEFDRVGVKKMFASFAKLVKVE
jgi:DNA helicase-2/ATP-dependent DNA helicase PcrA